MTARPSRSAHRDRGGRGAGGGRVWAEKVPFVVLSGAASVVGLEALERNQRMNPIDKLGVQGRRSEAAEHFRRAPAIKPGLREAQRNLDQNLAGGSPTR